MRQLKGKAEERRRTNAAALMLSSTSFNANSSALTVSGVDVLVGRLARSRLEGGSLSWETFAELGMSLMTPVACQLG
jgi:hypothetical protein